MKQPVSDKNIYSPLMPEDMTFCEFPECGDIATWRCYPHTSLFGSLALCDRCKQEVERSESLIVMTPTFYLEQAKRTLYPDLTVNERLGLCGLGLSGEIGEVTDILKKHL